MYALIYICNKDCNSSAINKSVSVHRTLKFEIGNQKKMKRVYELEVYKLAEELSDLVWYDFDKWNKKIQNTVGYQIIQSSDSIAAI